MVLICYVDSSAFSFSLHAKPDNMTIINSYEHIYDDCNYYKYNNIFNKNVIQLNLIKIKYIYDKIIESEIL